MPAVPAFVFLAAALVCSFLGRVLLIGPAFGVSTAWGFTVLFAPFGPLLFRMKYRELAHPTRYWRLAVGPLMVLFFLNGGSAASQQALDYLKNLGKSAATTATAAAVNTTNPTEAAAGDTHFHLPVPGKVVAAAMAEADPKQPAVPALAAAKLVAAALPIPTPAATPSKAVAAAASAMPAALQVLSPADRIAANRLEFERLAVWYDNLKHERGYLRKGDVEAVVAYNAEAAKYQAALQLAKNEQTELTKLTAKK